MEWLQIAAIFDKFGADVLALGALAYVLTLILKKTLLKKAPKKYLTFVPFLLGILLYAAFSFFTHWQAPPVQETLQKGVAAGGAATVIHVVYEQFLRGGAPTEISVRTDCVREILAGFFEEVPEGLAENLCALAGEEDGQEKMRGLLAENLPEFTPSQRENLLKWLVKTIENV
ncbi:hypothetical protein ESZ91_05655 [Candidatus Borkfalkia ceftriaxoniphila]|uniref:Uncharacterized protein n=1 Tax=Candidatus Borkfalkia ceftriaxoniphila TaxID=2508949 RepID=A0A4Q2KEE8_9FIRM|nr:hypothetical protein [Candidatus Borkfalkia ceftriaxoniphila]RXZ61872.1 hypothetical protein ESZ91_05655 [Candidatus Borkfalkia ceftriaxoniphila]